MRTRWRPTRTLTLTLTPQPQPSHPNPNPNPNQVATNANQSTINGQIVAQIKVKLDEIAGITLEIRRMEKLTEALTKKVIWGRYRGDVGEI